MRARRTVLGSLVCAALVLAACGGDDDNGVTAPDDDGSVDTEAPADDVDAPDDADDAPDDAEDAPDDDAPPPPADGDFDLSATFHYGEAALTSLDPHLARTLYDNTYLYPVFDRLIHYDAEGNLEPGLAVEWEFLDDGAAFEMWLREGVTFHDGEPFNADAVIANLERGRTMEGSQVATELAVIESVEALDDYHVRIEFSGPAAPVPLFFADRAGMMMSPASLDDPDVDRNPVGAGMYRFERLLDDELVEYSRFEDYWNPDDVKNELLRIVTISDDAARLNALRTGQIDATWVDESAAETLVNDGFNLETISRLGLFHLQLNRAMEPFDDAQVRLALSHAIDREGITEGVLFGLAEPTVQAMPPGNIGHNPDMTLDVVPYDPDLARELLADAGYGDGFSFECVVVNTSGYIARAEAVQAMFAEVGVDMQLRIIAGGEIIPIFYVDAEAPCAATPYGGRLDPSQTIGLMFSDEGFLNPGRATTDRVMEIHREALAELDQDRRIELFQEFSEIYVNEALNLSLHYMSFPFAYHDGVIGVDELFDIRPFDIRGVGLAAG